MDNWKTVVGVFETGSEAEQALAALRAARFSDEQIGVLSGPLVSVGGPAGAVAGGLVGGLAGWAAGAGLIPVAGPFLAGGALATALEGAALGGTAGAVVEALVRAGVSEKQARAHEADLRAGRVLVTVSTDVRAEEAVATLRRCGATVDAGPAPSTPRPA
jgi:hypothetical protein